MLWYKVSSREIKNGVCVYKHTLLFMCLCASRWLLWPRHPLSEKVSRRQAMGKGWLQGKIRSITAKHKTRSLAMHNIQTLLNNITFRVLSVAPFAFVHLRLWGICSITCDMCQKHDFSWGFPSFSGQSHNLESLAANLILSMVLRMYYFSVHSPYIYHSINEKKIISLINNILAVHQFIDNT